MAEVNWEKLKEGNSHASREQKEESSGSERRRLSSDETSKSKTMKKPWKKRLLETFIDEDFNLKNLRRFVIKEVIAPSIQDAIMDGVNGALGMMFGIGIVRKGYGRNIAKSESKIRYGSYFSGDSSKPTKSVPEERRKDNSIEFEYQMKDSKQKALKIMSDLEELLAEYPEEGVTIADYKDAFGVTTEHTDNKYGWKDLAGMRLERVPKAFYDDDLHRYIDGWAVIMPPEHAL